MTTLSTKKSRRSRKIHKTKITVLINEKIFDSFCATAKELGLRRDAYLNQQLPEEISCLAKAPQGSALGERVLRTLNSHVKDLVRVGITLDSEVAKRITDVCSEKHVVRDHFLESCLVLFEKVLFDATTLIYNPSNYRDEHAYDNLTMNDKEVAGLVSKLSEGQESNVKIRPST